MNKLLPILALFGFELVQSEVSKQLDYNLEDFFFFIVDDQFYFESQNQKELFESKYIKIKEHQGSFFYKVRDELDVKYEYDTQILSSNKLLKDDQFLRLVGLKNRADSIINNFDSRVEDYSKKSALSKETYENKFTRKVGCLESLFSKKPPKEEKLNILNPGDWKTWALWTGSYYILSGYYKQDEANGYRDDWRTNLSQSTWNNYEDANFESKINYVAGTGMLAFVGINQLFKVNKEYTEIKYRHPEYKNLKEPIRKQSLSYDEIKLLVDTYNQQIYNNIINNK